MNRETLIAKANELEDLIIEMGDIDSAEVLFDMYKSCILSLKQQDDDYPIDQATRFLDICDVIDQKLPNVSDIEFEQYAIYLRLLAICLEERMT